MMIPSIKPIQFDCPAMYKIIVQGRIDPAMSVRLEGMAIRVGTLDKKNSFTTLEGELSDQSALAGVLNSLYELHLLILSVECLDASFGETLANGGQDPEKCK